MIQLDDSPKSEIYRFSPVLDEATYHKTIHYIAVKVQKLMQTLLKKNLPLDTITIFAHYPDEYEYVKDLLDSQGSSSTFSSASTHYIKTNLALTGHNIQNLGIRRPDPYRMQVGYADAPVENYKSLKSAYSHNPYIREVTSRLGQIMLEVWHPDFDVLGYIVRTEDHKN